MIKKIICFGIIIVMAIAIVACTPKNDDSFYSLQEAYEFGMLTQNDLKNIAYYQNGSSADESFIAKPKTQENLSEETENAIKEAIAYDLQNQNPNPIKEAKSDDITIIKYYGKYNNCVAVMVTDNYSEYDDAEWEIEVDSVIFRYGNGNRIIVWKES